MENIMELRERVSALEQDEKSVHRRLDNLEKLVESVHILATEMKETKKEVNNFGERLEVIEHKPIKRYDTLVTSLITGLAGGIVGYLINFIK